MNTEYNIVHSSEGFKVQVGPKAWLPGVFTNLHHAETAGKIYVNGKLAAAKRRKPRTKKA